MSTRNTPTAVTAVCLSFNYCAPTQSFASTMERLHNALPNRRNNGKKKQVKTMPAKTTD